MFSATVGPLVTPRRVVDAIISGEADAGPLDAWWHALLRRHEPHIAARLRVITRTAPAPIPLVVCAAVVPENQRRRLAAALEKVGDAEDVASERDVLLLRRFSPPDLRSYQALIDNAREADALGYDRLQ